MDGAGEGREAERAAPANVYLAVNTKFHSAPTWSRRCRRCAGQHDTLTEINQSDFTPRPPQPPPLPPPTSVFFPSFPPSPKGTLPLQMKTFLLFYLSLLPVLLTSTPPYLAVSLLIINATPLIRPISPATPTSFSPREEGVGGQKLVSNLGGRVGVGGGGGCASVSMNA